MSVRTVFAFSSILRKTMRAVVWLVLLVALSIQGCNSDNGPEPPVGIEVSPATATLTWIGETVQLTGEVVDANGNGIGGAGIASWSADPTSVCTVNNQGLVTAAGGGTCTVTAHSNTSPVVDGEATVTVSQEAAALSWEVQPGGAKAGEMLPASQVCVQDEGGTTVGGDDATSVSVAIGSNPDGGTLTGTATHTVSSGCADFDDLSIDVEGAYTLMASATGLPAEESNSFDVGANPTAVTVSCPDPALESIGETAQCTAQVWSDGRELSNVPLTWGSDPTSVCTVDNAGLVTAVADGDCTVTATETINSHSGSDAVTVAQVATQLAFAVQPTDGKAEDILPTMTVCTQDALGSTVASDNTTQVTMAIGTNPSGGALTGTFPGTVSSGCVEFDDLSLDLEGDGYTLTADDANGLTAATSAAFKVARNVATVVVTCPDAALESIGETAPCAAEARSPAGRVIPDPDLAGDALAFTWGPADPATVCTVDNTGLVTAVDNGTCTVPAEVDGVSGSDAITVEQKAVRLTIVPPDFVLLAIGEQATLTVEAFDALDNPIVSPTVAVQCTPGGVVNAAGLDLTGAAAGVADCEVTSGTAADAARVAVVEQKGFAAIVTTDTDLYRVTATAGGDIQVDFWMIRPSGGDGDLGSIQGSLTWDASVLTYVSSGAVESGWTWVPNETNVGTGTLGFAAFSATGTASTFVLAQVTFTPAAGISDLDLSVSAAGDALGTNITAFVEAVGTQVTVE